MSLIGSIMPKKKKGEEKNALEKARSALKKADNANTPLSIKRKLATAGKK